MELDPTKLWFTVTLPACVLVMLTAPSAESETVTPGFLPRPASWNGTLRSAFQAMVPGDVTVGAAIVAVADSTCGLAAAAVAAKTPTTNATIPPTATLLLNRYRKTLPLASLLSSRRPYHPSTSAKSPPRGSHGSAVGCASR